MKTFDLEPRPLPDASKLPLGLVEITVWTNTSSTGRSGTAYTNDSTGWYNSRQVYDRLIPGNEYVWSFQTFKISDFSLGWFRMEKNRPSALVRLAAWALERWARDEKLL